MKYVPCPNVNRKPSFLEETDRVTIFDILGELYCAQ